jgi:hypothetical protein
MELSKNQGTQKQIAEKLKHIFNYLMICVYLSLGIFLITQGWYALSKNQTIGIGVLLILYTAFRIFRIYHEGRKAENDDEITVK